jgi:small-conductance mechanosensitive channel
VGIGFGLQVITQNFVSGLILLAERPVKIGDWVKLGDQEGDIRRISLRSTEIQVGDKSTLIVPNSELVTKTVRNMTMGNNQGRIQIQFAVPPSTDVGNLRQALLDAYTAHTNVLKQPAPTVYIDSIAGGQITINSFAYVASPRQVYATRSDLYFSLLQILAERNIPLSTPTDIHITRDPQEWGLCTGGSPAAGKRPDCLRAPHCKEPPVVGCARAPVRTYPPPASRHGSTTRGSPDHPLRGPARTTR